MTILSPYKGPPYLNLTPTSEAPTRPTLFNFSKYMTLIPFVRNAAFTSLDVVNTQNFVLETPI